MLLLSPVFYYEKIRERFANSYLAEDTTQTIVGIDCEYISSEQTDFAGLKSYFKAQKFDAPFAGLFGVLGYGVKKSPSLTPRSTISPTFSTLTPAPTCTLIKIAKFTLFTATMSSITIF